MNQSINAGDDIVNCFHDQFSSVYDNTIITLPLINHTYSDSIKNYCSLNLFSRVLNAIDVLEYVDFKN